MSRVLENLYLGGLEDASNSKRLRDLGVRAILITAKELPAFHARGFVYMKINADGGEEAELRKHFAEVSKLIDFNLPKGGVLVHCVDGATRSAAFVAAYLMKSRKIGFEKAVSWLSSVRRVNISRCVERQLRDFERDEINTGNPKHIRSEAVRRYQKPVNKTLSRAGEQMLEYMNRKDHATASSKQYLEMIKVYKKCLDPKSKAAGNQLLYSKGKEHQRAKRVKKKSLSVQKVTRKGELPGGIFQQSKLFLKTSERKRNGNGGLAQQSNSSVKIGRGRIRSPEQDSKKSISLRKSNILKTERFLSCEKRLKLTQGAKRAETERAMLIELRKPCEPNFGVGSGFPGQNSDLRSISKKDDTILYTERQMEASKSQFALDSSVKASNGNRGKSRKILKNQKLKLKGSQAGKFSKISLEAGNLRKGGVLATEEWARKAMNQTKKVNPKALGSSKRLDSLKGNSKGRKGLKTRSKNLHLGLKTKNSSKSGILEKPRNLNFKSPKQTSKKKNPKELAPFEFGSADNDTRKALLAVLQDDSQKGLYRLRKNKKRDSRRKKANLTMWGRKKDQKISKKDANRKISEPGDYKEALNEGEYEDMGKIKTLGMGRGKTSFGPGTRPTRPSQRDTSEISNQHKSSRLQQSGYKCGSKMGEKRMPTLTCRDSQPLFHLKRQKSAHLAKVKSKKGLLKQKLQKQTQRGFNLRQLKSLHPEHKNLKLGKQRKERPDQSKPDRFRKDPTIDSLPNNLAGDILSKTDNQHYLLDQRSPKPISKNCRTRHLTEDRSPDFKTQPKDQLKKHFRFEINKSMNFVSSFGNQRKLKKFKAKHLYQQEGKYKSKQLRLLAEEALDPKRLMNRLHFKVQNRLKQFRAVAGSQVKRRKGGSKGNLIQQLRFQNLVPSEKASGSKPKARKGLYFRHGKKKHGRGKGVFKSQSIDLDNTGSIQIDRKSVALSIDELSNSESAISISGYPQLDCERALLKRKSLFHTGKPEIISNFRFSQKNQPSETSKSQSKSKSRLTPKAGGGKLIPRLRLQKASRIKLYSQKLNARLGVSSDLRKPKPSLKRLLVASKSPDNKPQFGVQSNMTSQKSVRLVSGMGPSPFSDMNNQIPSEIQKKSLRLKLKKKRQNKSPGSGRFGGVTLGAKFRTSESNQKLAKQINFITSGTPPKQGGQVASSVTSNALPENGENRPSADTETIKTTVDTGSKDSSRSGTSNMFSSQGSFNLYSKNKTNNYLVKRIKGRITRKKEKRTRGLSQQNSKLFGGVIGK